MDARALAQEPDALPMVRALSRMHDLVALVGPSGEVLWASKGLESLCGGRGRRGSHWIGTLVSAPSADLEVRLRAGDPLAGELVELHRAGGRALPARVSAIQLGCGATVVIFRREDHRRAGDEFRSRIEALSMVLEGVPDGVLILDRSRFVAWANPAMAEIAGCAVSELIDQPLVLLLNSPEDIERIASTLRPNGPDGAQEFEIRRSNGPPTCVSVNLRPLSLPDGTELGSVAYVRDVTERHQIETELERKAEELQNWVNAVSHDLRSPLVAVLGFARLLGEDYGDRLDEQGRRFLRRIEEAGRTMESLVHDLLEFARIGRSEPKRVHVDPREVLLQLQAELKPRLDEAEVDLRLPADPPLIWCDRTQLYQVLSNLVGNALDHAGPSQHPVVEVDVLAEADRQHLIVRDWGRGIDPTDHERIFEIFQTHGVPRHGRRGTGIGLAIVRKIADAHGGAAWVESRPGEGSTFHVTFASA